MRVSLFMVVALAGVAAAACSSGSPGPATTQNPGPPPGDKNMCDPTCTGSNGGTVSPDVNPDGIPYPQPAGGYGSHPRLGNAAGNVIEDFSFLGYPNAVVATTLSKIKLADYYDPCNKRYKLIHVSVAAVWCGPCNMETDNTVANKAMIDAAKVVFLQALDDGAQVGVAATQQDLNGWISYHKSNFTEMLDPNPGQLGPFFDAAAIPFNMNIDPRTMEILDSGEGFSGNIMDDINQGLMEVKTAPNYPLPADAHCG